MNTRENCDIREYLANILTSARRSGWQGWDPFDALESPLARTPLFRSPWMRILWTQLFKRSPLNLRTLFRVPKLMNPKALALFASAACEKGAQGNPVAEPLAHELLETLSNMKAAGAPGSAWGYPFAWQSRAFFAPKNTPNVIVTSFCGHAYLDGYRASGQEEHLREARGACEFVLRGLNRTLRKDTYCFSYTPLDRSRIHNANLLAASLLCRTGDATGEASLIEAGLCSALYSQAAQNPDGSWFYGEAPNQQWIDGFHTGYNLIAIEEVMRSARRMDFKRALTSAFSFYVQRFFLPDGTPAYFPDRVRPIDIHSAAVAVLTFSKLSRIFPEGGALAERVLTWTLSRMLHPSQRGFIYRKGRFFDIRIPYLRWADAWMCRAIAGYLSSNLQEVAYAPNTTARLPN